MSNKTKMPAGGLTIPGEAGQEDVVLELAKRWGADALRDSNSTRLSPELLQAGMKIYSTICLVRDDQEWIRKHPDRQPQKFLMSEPVTATSEPLTIDPMAGYFREKYRLDTDHNPHEWWQVFDRTTGEEVPTDWWHYDSQTGKVIVRKVNKFHIYTVNFLVYQIWDSTSMYDHLINNWDRPKVVCTDPYYPDAYRHLMDYFDRWLRDHPHTDVVRLTTLAYHFVLDSDETGADKYRDWTGYMDTVSIPALLDFEKEYGYRLTSEDFVDQGYYNATHRLPSRRYRDWMDFIHRFVIRFGKELVEKIHKAGKKAAIFQGDHWIGVEPYSDDYGEMNVDINVGACEDGVALRRLADSPFDEVKEIRLYPYFFPDVFRKNGDPEGELLSNWVKIRRAMLRKPIDRIGFGGYLSLASRFPGFVERVEQVAREFREIKTYSGGTEPFTPPVSVAVLNAWGKWRSWINSFGKDQKFFVKRPDVIAVAGSNLLECLSGLPVNIRFLSFDDVLVNGIPRDVDVLINEGEAGSAWSGGEYWRNPDLVAMIREWVFNGGGLIGNIEPSAVDHQGRFFQLCDVLGVDKEIGHSVMTSARRFTPQPDHFVLNGINSPLNFDAEKSYVFVCQPDTTVLRTDPTGQHVLLAVHEYGQGRCLYASGLPFSFPNSRLLHRALFWCARKESFLKRWYSENPFTDCAFYPQNKSWVVVNHTAELQETTVFDGRELPRRVVLQPLEMKWFAG